tara:strand:- start:257 stop:1081 length:825 start_codon:yes stop_codon:yes gene_type:complete
MKTKIIAEIGWNHMGEASLAKDMISSAANAGATIAKFQYWDPKHLIKGEWDVDGRREIYEKAALNPEKILELQSICGENNIGFLISVFGTNGAKVVKDLNINSIKIPSHEVANKKLINYCSENFDEIYFSSGASTEGEVTYANQVFKNNKNNYCLMHCISSYPCPSEKSNLPRLEWLNSLHENIGLSDHTQSLIAPSISLSYGVSVIEKHFTTNKNLPGRDNKFALDPAEFELMVKNIQESEKMNINHGIDFIDIETDTVKNYRGRWEPADYES